MCCQNNSLDYWLRLKSCAHFHLLGYLTPVLQASEPREPLMRALRWTECEPPACTMRDLCNSAEIPLRRSSSFPAVLLVDLKLQSCRKWRELVRNMLPQQQKIIHNLPGVYTEMWPRWTCSLEPWMQGWCWNRCRQRRDFNNIQSQTICPIYEPLRGVQELFEFKNYIY